MSIATARAVSANEPRHTELSLPSAACVFRNSLKGKRCALSSTDGMHAVVSLRRLNRISRVVFRATRSGVCAHGSSRGSRREISGRRSVIDTRVSLKIETRRLSLRERSEASRAEPESAIRHNGHSGWDLGCHQCSHKNDPGAIAGVVAV